MRDFTGFCELVKVEQNKSSNSASNTPFVTKSSSTLLRIGLSKLGSCGMVEGDFARLEASFTAGTADLLDLKIEKNQKDFYDQIYIQNMSQIGLLK